MMVPKFNFETGIALLYLVFAGVWIWLSDFVLAIFITDPAYLTRLQTAKGWIFVLVTTGLLFIILQKYMQRQRQSAAKLSENEERLRMALHAANQGMYDLNIQTGTAFVNSIYAQMLGYAPETFVETNQRWLDRMHPEDRERVANAFQSYLAGRTPEYRTEFRQQTRSGEWKWILSIGSIVERDAAGKPIRMSGTHTDITENKKAALEIAKLNEDIVQAYQATIEGWSLAMDLHDQETVGHTRRVTDMTVGLARSMNIPEDQIVHIRHGALLHDIGKMGIPDHILRKPARLNREERAIIEKHPMYAFEMLQSIEFLDPSLEIPLLHHEKWDGSGYPFGYRGEQIPISARIFSVVDVYDALTSDRPYRDALAQEKAIEYIRTQSGKHFDPEVVDTFLDYLEQQPEAQVIQDW
jgi:PAS domain S-box-containing protein/putative nucleotidyltransferase with HDIG domain